MNLAPLRTKRFWSRNSLSWRGVVREPFVRDAVVLESGGSRTQVTRSNARPQRRAVPACLIPATNAACLQRLLSAAAASARIRLAASTQLSACESAEKLDSAVQLTNPGQAQFVFPKRSGSAARCWGIWVLALSRHRGADGGRDDHRAAAFDVLDPGGAPADAPPSSAQGAAAGQILSNGLILKIG